ncbi:AAA family ATPase [Methylovorus glucosotrophus]|uniref:Sporulation domain protein n=1 Tax=Methylovorus glucosotrophus (strain SIP3-4) TaxID=582744 RepID=C6X857_METGS|nr:AAA family ATPase [Methylovorus glucosotrophus]ACT49327.1 Sporulation domain protein [Methylovorus glucosotrophus SIP3-4]
MYYAHFGLKEPPYKITPNTDVFFTGGKRGAVLDALIYAIRSGEGIIKVVGEVGSGKTMLCRMLQTQLPDSIETVYLANPSMAPDEVLYAVAFELQLKLPKNADKFHVMQILQQYLLDRHAAGKQVVVFVEEAQGMPLATLEELRLLSNLETKHDKLLQIVLFGQPELDSNLNASHIRQLRERITHSFKLQPLDQQEVSEYLMFRLRAAGYFGPPLFTPAAIKLLSRTAEGLVRRVNVLADKALLAAFSDNVYQVRPQHVRSAIADSEFSQQAQQNRWRRWQFALGGLTLCAGLAAGYIGHQWQSGKPISQPVNAPVVAPSSAPVVSKPRAEEVKLTSAAGTAIQSSAAEQPTASAVQDVLEARLQATHTWLDRQIETTVTLQLMGAYRDEDMRDALKTLALKLSPDDLYVVRTRVGGQPFLSLFYGSFDNREEAASALKQLPESVRANQPHMRTVGGITKEIKQLQ